MNNILKVKEKCTGCTACVNSCSFNGISMQRDKLGFYYPSIDEKSCVNCGKCLKVCPVAEDKERSDSRINAYYGAVLDKNVVASSSSGGAFTLMADYVIKNGGLVLGAIIDYDELEVVYSSTDENDLDELRRSKYVSSFPKEIFKSVKTQLNEGRLVLFCGLPCHVDGLMSYLEKDYDNLICVDFICGGVASPKFFREHLSFLEEKYKAKVKKVNFRAKLCGWKEHSIKIDFSNGKAYSSLARFDSFFQGYFEKVYQRDSCYKCQYRLAHCSDIIIADYWGGLKKGRANDTGVSMVITNSRKGDEFFEKALEGRDKEFTKMPLKDSDYVFKSETERYEKGNLRKKEFINLYDKFGFRKTTKKTYHLGLWKKKLRQKISKILSKRR